MNCLLTVALKQEWVAGLVDPSSNLRSCFVIWARALYGGGGSSLRSWSQGRMFCVHGHFVRANQPAANTWVTYRCIHINVCFYVY